LDDKARVENQYDAKLCPGNSDLPLRTSNR